MYCSNRISPVGNSGCFPPRENQLRQSRVTQPTVHAGCFRVHRTLTWTTGSLTCAQMLMHPIAHGVVRTHVRESALKVDPGRKIPCRTGESNLRQRLAGPMLGPTELHPPPPPPLPPTSYCPFYSPQVQLTGRHSCHADRYIQGYRPFVFRSGGGDKRMARLVLSHTDGQQHAAAATAVL